MSESPAIQTAMECLRKFPKAGSHTLALKLYKKSPELWPTFNACCLLVRRLRGKQGQHHRDVYRQTVKDEREYDRKKQFKLPEGRKEIDGWGKYAIDTPGYWLVMSDAHIPFHEHEIIRRVVKHAKRENIKGVLLNGDIADCFAVSHWQKDPRKRDFAEELDTLQKFVCWIRSEFPKARRVWKWGNHEERYDVYMQVKAPELLDVPEFQYEELSHANKHGFEVVKDKRPIQLGKLGVIHGHEYKRQFSNPVSAARGIFLKARVSTLCGHWHEASNTSKRDMWGHLTTCWSTGCLCDLNPSYGPLNEWGHGAALVRINNQGAYEVMLSRDVDGELWR